MSNHGCPAIDGRKPHQGSQTDVDQICGRWRKQLRDVIGVAEGETGLGGEAEAFGKLLRLIYGGRGEINSDHARTCVRPGERILAEVALQMYEIEAGDVTEQCLLPRTRRCALRYPFIDAVKRGATMRRHRGFPVSKIRLEELITGSGVMRHGALQANATHDGRPKPDPPGRSNGGVPWASTLVPVISARSALCKVPRCAGWPR